MIKKEKHRHPAVAPLAVLALAFVAIPASIPYAQPQAIAKDDAARKRLVEVAFKYRGVPYVYGAESPKAFDCSGFVRYVYREAYGMELPRSARGFYGVGLPIDWKAAKPGDVFVYDTVGGAPSHVSIFVGDGTVIHAVSDGPKTGVIVSPLTDRYWAPRLIAARSFIAATAPALTAPTAKPATAAATSPGQASAKVAAEEQAIADIGIVIPARKADFVDRIPTQAGTSVAFTITNGTGQEGVFTVLFFRVDPKSLKLEQIHEERARLAPKAALGLPPYRFDKPGKYKLVVKDSWGDQRFVREFAVTAPSR
ncbi:MAG: C40 family peptidase [Spirochaetes bacterium]|nr:C40 family peptidase [Spirochaetota bacterium]MBU1079877.1 C40 family peptidase [Spirochaetota bacterium]